MKKGVFCGVGVGPGDPELMTLKAVRVLERCPVIAAPRTKSGEMLALDIAAAAVDLGEKTIVPLYFSMERDKVVQHALSLGLDTGFMQEKSSAREEYTPPFDLEGV